jgi:hypothetical protein
MFHKLFVASVLFLAACGPPSLSTPKTAVTSCCEALACASKEYEECINDGGSIVQGIERVNCHCYNQPSRRNDDNDSTFAHDNGHGDRDTSDRGGHTVCAH